MGLIHNYMMNILLAGVWNKIKPKGIFIAGGWKEVSTVSVLRNGSWQRLWIAAIANS